jgi:hypothetical protein
MLLVILPAAAEAADAARNRPPVARPEVYATREDSPLVATKTRDVLKNDRDPEGDRLVARAATQPDHGALELASNGTFSYAAAQDYHGPDSFQYRACERDRKSVCSRPVSVSLTVASVNDAPGTANDSYATEEDAPLTVAAPGLLGNDRDVEGSDLTARIDREPGQGNLSLDPDGSFTYTPAADWIGDASFSYTVSDGESTSSPAEVRISVRAANDPPDARDDRASTPEDTAARISVLANDTDPDPDATLSVSSHGQPEHGTVRCEGSSCEYLPAADYHGSDAFTYETSDGQATDTATVEVQVDAVDDPPLVRIDAYTARGNATTIVDAPGGVLANDHDVDGDALTVVTYNQPRHGQLTLRSDGSFTFRPERDFTGTTSFTYGVSDGAGPAVSATVSLRVK